ncbi:MAG: tRNA epoxyqueuosine(34) reductase QueG [Candidatus Hydrogenedentota bacterium]
MSSAYRHSEALKTRARELGFDACGVARAEPPDPEDRLGQWLAAGYHADMYWIAHTRDIRQDATQKVPGARSVVVVAHTYYQPRPAPPPGAAQVAMYAWGRDYHRVLIKPLRALADYLGMLQPGTQSYAEIDSGPVLERCWAERAGIGWTGKNSLTLRQDMGSYFFLGTIITTAELAPGEPVADHCGSCRACIDACPANAIVAEGVVDSRRCIAYQTIENRADIPGDMQANFGRWVFGCDICQEVCPWNRFAKQTDTPDFTPRPHQVNPDAAELATLDAPTFHARYAGSPLMRPKHAGMVRNARIVLRNIRESPEHGS